MKVLGLGHVLATPRRLSDAEHPDAAQLEAIRAAGYDQYYVSPDSARTLAARAVVEALEDAGCHASDIGFIVAGQSTVPDYLAIDLACQVGAELGGLEVRTVNLVEGCGTGITTWFHARRLAADLRPGQVGVIVAAQRVSEPHIDRFGFMNAILGDGAAAAVVGRSDAPSTPCGFVYKGGHDISNTRFVDMMRIERGGGVDPVVLPNHDSRRDPLGRARAMELYSFSGRDLGEFLRLRADNTVRVIEASLRQAGWAKDDSLLVLHTLEGRGTIESLAWSLGIPEENTNADLVSEFGHVGCVDPLLSLDVLRKRGRIPPGARIVLSTISTGMKWASCLIEREPVNPEKQL
ncbi:3-oxoacyl-[acyl-carrier-protein] synthase III C-terminal domain-containing protein [Sorangium sp. So ce118]